MRTLEEYEIIGTCAHCGNKDRILYKENNRCDNCDGQFTHCSICDAEQHEDDLCRHVFRDDTFEWRGSGAYEPFDDGVKASFLRLIGLMPHGFASELRTAILAGEFYMFTLGGMIGSGSIQLNGIPWQNGSNYQSAMAEIGRGDESEEAVDGYLWLMSLYCGKTPDANEVTVGWLDDAIGGKVFKVKT